METRENCDVAKNDHENSEIDESLCKLNREVELADMLDVEKETIPSTGAVFVSSDGHVSIGDFVEVFNKFFNHLKTAFQAHSQCFSSWVSTICEGVSIVH